MTKSKYVLENLGKLTKFLENKHTMASELSKNNGMSVRLYNPDIVLSIIRHCSPCLLATQSINEFLQNLDLLLTEKPSDGFISKVMSHFWECRCPCRSICGLRRGTLRSSQETLVHSAWEYRCAVFLILTFWGRNKQTKKPWDNKIGQTLHNACF